MAKPKPNLAGLLDNIPEAPPLATRQTRQRLHGEVATERTVLVGANLPPVYARNLAFLHAETGRSKKQLLREALDMLFTSKGGAGIKF
ncbi:ribbon-helix-helix domain-containing protein [Aquamicrobium segne]|uniref:Ribbon-helix-helix domain-containing protein n=1 Tax=Aquamicrobium segne TaxID=469547 RepID=A0ABW0H3V0_9HYPH